LKRYAAIPASFIQINPSEKKTGMIFNGRNSLVPPDEFTVDLKASDMLTDIALHGLVKVVYAFKPC